MKKLLVFVMLLGFGIRQSEAQSMLRVRMADNSKINISVDGRYFNKAGTGITVGELPYGQHRLRIFQFVQNRHGRLFEEPIFTGNVKTYNGMVTLFVFDKYSGETNITEQEISAYTFNHPPSNEANRYSDQMNDNGNGNQGGNNNYNNNQGAPQRFRNYDNNNNNGGNNNENNSQYSAPPPPPAPPAQSSLTDDKMSELKTKVAAKAADIEKMNILKDALKNEKITVKDISTIFDWFTFETSKVDFAKWAYSITVDKDYFSDLENKLSYKNYVDDLDKFIKDNK